MLPALAWVVHHPAVLEPDADRVHRWGCRRLDGLAGILRRDAVLYRQTMRRDEDENARLRALVDGTESAVIGNRAAVTVNADSGRVAA